MTLILDGIAWCFCIILAINLAYTISMIIGTNKLTKELREENRAARGENNLPRVRGI